MQWRAKVSGQQAEEATSVAETDAHPPQCGPTTQRFILVAGHYDDDVSSVEKIF